MNGKRKRPALPLPTTVQGWLVEIRLALADAREAVPFAPLTGTEIGETDLFHLAPAVCLKFRGKNVSGRELNRVTEAALATYVANSEWEKLAPTLAFALCYVGAHFAMDLVTGEMAERILNYCENRLDEPPPAP